MPKPEAHSPEDAAEDLLRRFGTGGLPVDVEEIAGDCRVKIGRNHHNGLESAFAFRDSERSIIGVNTRTSPRRERWWLAHALGHIQLHDRPLITCYSLNLEIPASGASTGSPDEERDAHRFAAALLMPTELVLAELAAEHAARHPSRDALLAAIAARCAVSNEALGFRLISMGVIGG